MARMFSVDFNYKNETYTASVTVSSEPGAPINVYVPDERLHQMLPGGKLVLEGESICVTDNKVKGDELKDSIAKAVQKHENDIPERSLWN